MIIHHTLKRYFAKYPWSYLLYFNGDICHLLKQFFVICRCQAQHPPAQHPPNLVTQETVCSNYLQGI